MNVDYIIVGFGLAGMCFAERLRQNNKSFIVFEDNSQKSSLVAGGTYNPLVLKRFTPVWNGNSQLTLARLFFKQLEENFNEIYDNPLLTRKIFSSVGDVNNWFIASDKASISKYINPKVSNETIPGVITSYGYGELSGTGWIDIKKILSSYKKLLIEKYSFIQESFEYSKLLISNDSVRYNTFTASKIVFAEGFGLKNNLYFNYLPLNGTKGETLDIYAPELQIDFQIKSTVFVFPLGNHYYKVGATFNWDDKTSIASDEGRKELVDKLKKVISVPYEIVSQAAGIRPTVIDRRPLVGVHKSNKNIAILNGLGTRGVMIAPTVSKQLFDHLEYNIPLPKEIDIQRFSK